MARKAQWLLALLIVGALIPGCRSGRAERRASLVVRGGPLLREVFAKLTSRFRAAHPEVDLRTDFSCPPCVLTGRMEEGIDMDVFVSAGDVELKLLGEGGLLDLSTTVPIGSAHLVLAVPPDNPANVRALIDLHRPEVKHIAIGDPEQTSPGRYSHQAFERMGLWEELEGKLVLSKTGCEALKTVVLGQAEAALLYNFCLQDEAGEPSVVGEVPTELHDPIIIGLTTAPGSEGAAAEAFIAFMQSPEAQAILRAHGIEPPPVELATGG